MQTKKLSSIYAQGTSKSYFSTPGLYSTFLTRYCPKLTNATVNKHTIALNVLPLVLPRFSFGSTASLFHVKQVFSVVSRETRKKTMEKEKNVKKQNKSGLIKS